VNRPLGEVLADIIVETKRSAVLGARDMRNAASPHLKTTEERWVWYCEVGVLAKVQGGMKRIIGKGDTPDEAAADCYRQILAADRSDWIIDA
jgi:hypothetical protein